MPLVKNPIGRIPVAAALLVGGLLLSGCATEKYVDEHIAVVNQRIDGVDAKATDGIRRADAANAAAQAAGATAQAAASDAARANSRIDALTSRVDTLEAERVKRPRG